MTDLTHVWFTPAWDRSQLTDEEMSEPNAFEWWYFDMQGDDVSLVIVFGRKNPVLSRSKCSLFIELKQGASAFRRVRNYAEGRFPTSDGSPLELSVGPHSMVLTGDDPKNLLYHVAVRLPELDLDLDFRPTHHGFLPTVDGCYFTMRGRPSSRTCVSFSAPVTTATGTLRRDGQTTPLRGRGYHDHPWGTVQLFQTHREWNWGRAFTPQTATMFAEVIPRARYQGQLSFFYRAQTREFVPRVTETLELKGTDSRKQSLLGIAFPHRLDVLALDQRWEVQTTFPLLTTPMYERSEISWKGGAGDETGTGWLEYYRVGDAVVWLVFLAARIGAFFWRPFPWFGR